MSRLRAMSTTFETVTVADLPWFITAPGQFDMLYVGVAVFLLVGVLLIGLLYWNLHHLPHHLAQQKVQFMLVGALVLASMFTHMHILWIIALILAMIDIPDLLSPIRRIADASEGMLGGRALGGKGARRRGGD